MTGVQLGKIFAWAIGVLVLLWLLAQCLAGPNPTADPQQEQIERDAQQYAADCRKVWDALEMLGQTDHDNVQQVVDEIDLIASEINDPELSEMAYSFSARAQDLVVYTEAGDEEQLRENFELFRGLVEVDLSLRCSAATMSTG